MTVTPVLARVPRYVYALISEAMSVLLAVLIVVVNISTHDLFVSLIPVAIVGATHFYSVFVDIMSECSKTSSRDTLRSSF